MMHATENRAGRWYFRALIALFAVISRPMAVMGAVAVINDDNVATVRTSEVDVELTERTRSSTRESRSLVTASQQRDIDVHAGRVGERAHAK